MRPVIFVYQYFVAPEAFAAVATTPLKTFTSVNQLPYFQH